MHNWSVDNLTGHTDSISDAAMYQSMWNVTLRVNVIGPQIFEGNLNRHRYLQIAHIRQERYYYEHNFTRYNTTGLLTHWSESVRNNLNEKCPTKWTGRSELPHRQASSLELIYSRLFPAELFKEQNL
jgi:hypothetical protein